MNKLLLGAPVFLILSSISASRLAKDDLKTFAADDPAIRYSGRGDFSDPKHPRFWAPGCTVTARFVGGSCDALINDQVLWGKSHNYLEVVVDNGTPFRVQTTGKENVIPVAKGLSDGVHTVAICKDTESGIGYVEFVGFRCERLVKPPKAPRRKMEFIGDSITCGTGSDASVKACGVGEWYDQHNAYLSYGPSTARRLGAEWHVTAASGIGVHHSCCDMKVTMPEVYDRVDVSGNATGTWDAKRYQPDVVTVCLGQNDGAGEPEAFQKAYRTFVESLRARYPRAQIVLLTSPMADERLAAYQKEALPKIAAGEANVHTYAFSKRFSHGCGTHPSVEEHQAMADELTAFLKTHLRW